MAAHSVTALVEAAGVQEWTESKCWEYIVALDTAPWASELTLGNYAQLRSLLFHGEYDKLIRDTILVVLKDQLELYERYGYPDTHEEWNANDLPEAK